MLKRSYFKPGQSVQWIPGAFDTPQKPLVASLCPEMLSPTYQFLAQPWNQPFPQTALVPFSRCQDRSSLLGQLLFLGLLGVET